MSTRPASLMTLFLVLTTFTALPATADVRPPDVEFAVSHPGGHQFRVAGSLPPLGTATISGDVFVLALAPTLSYDRWVGGATNLDARRWVAQSIPQEYRGRYDFIAVFTSFPFDLGTNVQGMYWEVKNDTQGIGIPLFDMANEFGSPNLQGFIDAGPVSTYLTPEGAFDREKALALLNHELGHRWLARCRFLDGGSPSTALLGVDGSHWSYLLDSDASFMYGADWQPNGDGTFTATQITQRFSDLDLYLMGFLAPADVQPFTLLVNPSISSEQYPQAGATVAATPRTLTVDHVIAAEGPRQPSWEQERRELRIGLVFLVQGGETPDPEQVNSLQQLRPAWQHSFFAQTRGAGVIDLGTGGFPPAGTATGDLQAAADWLAGNLDDAGTWQDSSVTRIRDTSEAVAALESYPAHAAIVSQASQVLATLVSPSTELLAQRAETALRRSQPGAQTLVDELLPMRASDGGWGALLGYSSDTVSTARAARALLLGGRHAEAQTAWGWMTQTQNPDGGWGWRPGTSSSVMPTVEALGAGRLADGGTGTPAWAQHAIAFLALYQGPDGGIGSPFADVSQTASFLKAVQGLSVDQAVVSSAVEFLVRRQNADGSWEGSAHKTALTLAALAPLMLPDPFVQANEIWIEPAPAYEGDSLHILAAVRNGGHAVPAGLPYRFEIVNSGGIALASHDGTLPAIPAFGFVAAEVEDWQTQLPPGTYTLRVVLDPAGQAADRNPGNNMASVPLLVKEYTQGTDPAVLQAEVAAIPTAISRIPQAISISGQARNYGYTGASGVVLRVFDGPVSQGTVVGSVTVDLPPRGTVPFQVEVSIGQAKPTTLTVVIDPDNVTGDPDPSNNTVVLALTLQQTTDVAIENGSFSAAPTALQVGDPVVLTANVVNHGTVAVSAMQFGFTYITGVPPQEHPVSLQTLSGTIQPGQSETVSLTWRPNVAAPVLEVRATADPQEYLADTDRSNNSASLVLEVQPSPLPNLSVTPADISVTPTQPEQGQTAHVAAVVRNAGANPSGAFAVEIRLDEPVAGPLVASLEVASLAAGEETVVEGDVTPDLPQDRMLWVNVDPAGSVAEYNEDDNLAFRVLDVRTLPDLSVSTGSIEVAPPFPRTGDPVLVTVEIANIGDQSAGAFEVELRDAADQIIDSSNLSGLPGGETTTITLSWVPAIVGEQTMRVVVNASHAVAEVTWNNNVASVQVPVQDTDLFLSSHYVSPDGDGILDDVTVYFRMPPAELRIADIAGTTARTLPVPPGAVSVVWDGRVDNGMLADDGLYRVWADDLVTWVAVDTNRSRLSDSLSGNFVTGTFDRLLLEGNVNEDSFRDGAALAAEAGWVLREAGTKPQAFDKVYRFDSEDRLELGDTPAAAKASGCNLQSGTATGSRLHWMCPSSHLIASYPGGSVRTVPFTGPGAMSPDGRWLLLGRGSDATFQLHDLDDPAQSFSFGPFRISGTSVPVSLVWAPDSSRAVGSVRDGSSSSFLVELTLDPSPAARKVTVSGYQSGTGVASLDTAVRFTSREIVWYTGNDFHVFDLTTGKLLAKALAAGPTHPCSGFGRPFYAKLSPDGRTVGSWTLCERELNSPQESSPSAAAANPNLRVRLLNWETRAMRTIAPELASLRWSANGSSLLGQLWFETTVTWLATANNLRASIRPRQLFGNAGIAISMIATDRNLDRYLIEYAPISTPNEFQPLGLARREPIFGGVWGTWLPPAKGRYLLRLTVWDRAGHVQQSTRQVSWAGERDIANLWVESQYLSPRSSPGVKDYLTVHFTVLRPCNLVFEIRDALDALVTRIPVAASQIGPRVLVWDGTDSTGNPVPDGNYTLSYQGASWPVTVDNTPPAINLTLGVTKEVRSDVGDRNLFVNDISMSVADPNLDRWRYETRDRLDPMAVWLEERSDQAAVSETFALGMEKLAAHAIRLSAADLAGNAGEVHRTLVEPRIVFVDSEPSCRKSSSSDPEEHCSYGNRPPLEEVEEGPGLLGESTAALSADWDTLLVQQALGAAWQEDLRLEYRTPAGNGLPPGAWQQGTVAIAETTVKREVTFTEGTTKRTAVGNLAVLYWDHVGMLLQPLEVRLVARSPEGQPVETAPVLFVPEAPLSIEYLGITHEGANFRVRNLSREPITGLGLQVWWCWDRLREKYRWVPLTAPGGLTLAPGQEAHVTSGCDVMCWSERYHPDAWGHLQIRAVGREPGAVSFPIKMISPDSWSPPRTSFVEASCASESGPQAPQGGRIFSTTTSSCVTFDSKKGCDTRTKIASSGGLLPFLPGLPAEPSSTPLVGYDLLLDGAVVFSADSPIPNVYFELDLSNVPEGTHVLSERFRYAPGMRGLLGECPRSWDLVVDRTPPTVRITAPAPGAEVCPLSGVLTVSHTLSDNGPTPVKRRLWLDNKPFEWDCDLKVDLRQVPAGTYVLKAEATDAAGHSACDSVPIVVLDIPWVRDAMARPRLFSPVNTTGRPQTTTLGFQSNVPGSFEVAISSAAGELRRVVAGNVGRGERVEYHWDGTDALGAPVPDGDYKALFRLISVCGAEDSAPVPSRPSDGDPYITVDRTPPEVVLVSPTEGQEVGAVIEASGRLRDQRFASWAVELRGESDCDDCFQVVATGEEPTGETPITLAQVQTRNLALEDHYLRLRALDGAGNETISDAIRVVRKPCTIFDGFALEPTLVSPNDDGTLDTVTATAFLVATADVRATVMDLGGTVVRTLMDWTLIEPDPSGLSLTWDGRNDAGELVGDGHYSVRLEGSLASDPSVVQVESLGVEVDVTPPTVALPGLVEGGLYGLPLALRGTVLDVHPGTYNLSLAGPDGTQESLASGKGEIQNQELSTLIGIPDGMYMAVLAADDAVGNHVTHEVTFTIDNAAPVAAILSPAPDHSHNPESGPWTLRGSLRATHPDRFEWAWAAGMDPQPADFAPVLAGTTIPDDGISLVEWPTAGLPEGAYTLRLLLVDQLQRTSESRVVVTLDGTPPQATLDEPQPGTVVSEPITIRGQVQDQNLSRWLLLLAPAGGGAGETILAEGNSPVNGALVEWRLLPPAGSYTLRLVANDRAGNTGDATSTFYVGDTTPAPPEGLHATLVNRNDVVLNWTPGPGIPPQGYFVYRGTTRVNAWPLTETTFADTGRPDGTYQYTVRARCTAGWESGPSNTATVIIDTVNPVATIATPGDGDRVGGLVRVRGTAAKDRFFKESRLEVRPQGSGSFALIARHTAPVVGGILAEWASGAVPDGLYELRLFAEDIHGNSASHLVTITVDNTAPLAPVLTQASLMAMDADGLHNDVRVAWTLASPPPDLAGYYLYRNGLLANAPNLVVGSPKAFLLPGPTYDDKNLPDGTYVYYLTAADSVENESEASNSSLPITVDTRRPHALVTSPANGSQFEGSVELVAETPDIDVVTLQFEYRKAGDTAWIPVGSPLPGPPYRAHFAPGELGTFLVRAVAADAGGPDPAPASITISSADLPPQPPFGLAARVDGDSVILTWSSSPSADVAGYRVYRGTTLVTPDLIPAALLSHTDLGVPEGSFYYTVKAVDQAGQEGTATPQVLAAVYKPSLFFRPPVTSLDKVSLSGSSCSGTCELQRDSGSGFETIATATTFSFPNVPLVTGINRFRAIASTTSGNRSKPSTPLTLVRHDLPPTPSAFTASPTGSTVTLDWVGQADPDAAGVQLRRDGVVINEPTSPLLYDPATHLLNGSHGTSSDWVRAVDGNPATGWTVTTSTAFVEWTWPAGLQAASFTSRWSPAPSRVDISVLVGGEWLWWDSRTCSGSGCPTTLTSSLGATATGIRVEFQKNTSSLTLADIEVQTTVRTPAPPYVDAGVSSGSRRYEILAANTWGQLSPSAIAIALVNVTPPPSPSSISAASGPGCGEATVSWAPPVPLPAWLSAYRVYRSVDSGGLSMVGATPAAATTYVDRGLPAGSLVVYQVTAVAIDNGAEVESAAAPTPPILVECDSPRPPEILLPARSGQVYQTATMRLDISGVAEARSIVRLLQDGVEISSAPARRGVEHPRSHIRCDGSGQIGLDGAGLLAVCRAYDYDIGQYRVAVMDLAAGTRTLIGNPGAESPTISPDGGLVVYAASVGGMRDLFLHRLSDGVETRLTADSAWESAPVFSPDSSSVAFVTGANVRQHNIGSSATTTLFTMTAASSPRPSFSPDGTKLAAISTTGPRVFNLGSGELLALPCAGTCTYSGHPFSPDGRVVLYVDSPGSVSQAWLRTFDLMSLVAGVPNVATGSAAALWADPGALLIRRHLSDSTWGLVLHELATGSEETIATEDFTGELWQSPLGRSFWVSSSSVCPIDPAAWGFRFPGIALHPGRNDFVARQELPAGTLDSGPLHVDPYTEYFPDPRVLSLTAQPSALSPGEETLIEALVVNGGIGIDQCDVSLLHVSPDGTTREVYRSSLYMETGRSIPIRYTWTAPLADGEHQWVILLDPDDRIVELDETNNGATTAVHVLPAGVSSSLSVTTDAPTYPAGSTVASNVVFVANSSPRIWTLQTTIEDDLGHPVSTIDIRTLPGFGPGRSEYSASWVIPTGLYPGSYRIHVRADAPGADPLEALAPFVVHAPTFVSARAVADRITARTGETLNITGRVTNLGVTPLPNVSVMLLVGPASGSGTIAYQLRSIDPLPAQAIVNLAWAWSTAGVDPGDYRVRAEVRNAQGQVVAVSPPFVFSITPAQLALTGRLTVTPAILEPGQALSLSAIVSNPASIPATVQIRAAVIDPSGPAEVSVQTSDVTLGAGETRQLSWSFDTSSFGLQAYAVLLRATGSAGGQQLDQILASGGFLATDLTPPVIQILSPQSALACGELVVRALVTDALTTVRRVFFRVGSSTQDLPLSIESISGAGDTFVATWTFQPGQDGPYTIAVFAEDSKGNLATSGPIDIEADSGPPTLSHDAPEDGACAAPPITITFEATDPHLMEVIATLNGQPYTSGTPIATEGSYNLVIEASDTCEQQTRIERSFHIGAGAGSADFHIDGAEDGGVYWQSVDVSWEVVGVDPQTVVATLNGEPVGQELHVEAPGTYTLRLEVELCGGTSERELTFHIVDLANSAAVAGGAGTVAMIDAGDEAGTEIEKWLRTHDVHVIRYETPCQALRGLRGGQVSAVVLYLPPGSRPINFDTCLPGTDPQETAVLVCPSHLAPCQQAPWELSIGVFRRGGLLVLGDLPPSMACFLPDLQAPGVHGGSKVIALTGPEGTGAVVVPPADLELSKVRSLHAAGATAALLSPRSGTSPSPECTGVREASLRIETPFSIDKRTVKVTVSSALVVLDREQGTLDPEGGKPLDENSGRWANLVVRRPGKLLVADVAAVDGGPLPQWVEVAVETVDDDGRPVRFAEAVDVGCNARVDDSRHPVAVLLLERIENNPEQEILASVRRYGRGQAAVAPFDIAHGANAAAEPVVAQMLEFVKPDDEWPVLPGMPVPVELWVSNKSPIDVPVRISADIDPALLLGAPGQPPPEAPPCYEEAIPAEGQQVYTFWVRMPEDGTPVAIPVRFEVDTSRGWYEFSQSTTTLVPECLPREAELGAVRSELAHLLLLHHLLTAELKAVVEHTLPELDALQNLPPDPAELNCALVVLRRAFARLAPFERPEVEAVRDRLARLLTMFARKHVEVTP